MKYYDWDEIRRVIEEYIPKGLVEAMVGMGEDWFWTAETVWSKEEGYIEDMDKPEMDNDRGIGGIYGSPWATPIIKLDIEGEDMILSKGVWRE